MTNTTRPATGAEHDELLRRAIRDLKLSTRYMHNDWVQTAVRQIEANAEALVVALDYHKTDAALVRRERDDWIKRAAKLRAERDRLAEQVQALHQRCDALWVNRSPHGPMTDPVARTIVTGDLPGEDIDDPYAWSEDMGAPAYEGEEATDATT